MKKMPQGARQRANCTAKGTLPCTRRQRTAKNKRRQCLCRATYLCRAVSSSLPCGISLPCALRLLCRALTFAVRISYCLPSVVSLPCVFSSSHGKDFFAVRMRTTKALKFIYFVYFSILPCKLQKIVHLQNDSHKFITNSTNLSQIHERNTNTSQT